jgi:hypothetical protein
MIEVLQMMSRSTPCCFTNSKMIEVSTIEPPAKFWGPRSPLYQLATRIYFFQPLSMEPLLPACSALLLAASATIRFDLSGCHAVVARINSKVSWSRAGPRNSPRNNGRVLCYSRVELKKRLIPILQVRAAIRCAMAYLSDCRTIFSSVRLPENESFQDRVAGLIDQTQSASETRWLRVPATLAKHPFFQFGAEETF